jgi:hypothetical protein
MCFSPEVSFASAGVLVGLGVYSLRLARRRLPSYWAFAVIPIGFGVQQFAEGLVWLGLHHGDEALARSGAAVFLFFALAVWPTWFSVAATLAEPRRGPRRLLAVIALVSTAWFWFVFLPVVTAAPPQLEASIEHHSIHYRYGDEVLFVGWARWTTTAAYILCASTPLLLLPRMRSQSLLVPASLLGASLAAWAYAHAFTSVWCFFAAALSAYTAYFFATAPPDTTGERGASPQVATP